MSLVKLRGAGLSLAVDRLGPVDAAPVIFLHGAGQNRRAWDEAAKAVAEMGWQTFTVDHRGHGDSDWPDEADYRWDHFAADVTELVGQMNQPPVVVGASLGGVSSLIAQSKVSRQLFRALVLVDVTPSMDIRGVRRILGFMAAHPEGFISLDEASSIIAQFTGRPKPESAEPLRQVLRLGDDGRWHWHWDTRFLEGRAEKVVDNPDFHIPEDNDLRIAMLAGAQRVEIPTLVVRGAQSDLVTPEAVQEVVSMISGSSYVDVAGAGHMVAGDQNDRFINAITQFLSTL